MARTKARNDLESAKKKGPIKKVPAIPLVKHPLRKQNITKNISESKKAKIMAGLASGVKKPFKFLPGDAASRDPYAWDLTDVGKVQTMVAVVYNKKARKKTSKKN